MRKFNICKSLKINPFKSVLNNYTSSRGFPVSPSFIKLIGLPMKIRLSAPGFGYPNAYNTIQNAIRGTATFKTIFYEVLHLNI
jgi:hypothetical protein